MSKLLLCPSSSEFTENAELFGIVKRSPEGVPQVQYLEHTEPISADFLKEMDLTEAEAGRLLRIASPCAQGACHHHGQSGCELVERVVQKIPANEIKQLPPCAIRLDCLWWAQEGVDACQRCDVVVTQSRLT